MGTEIERNLIISQLNLSECHQLMKTNIDCIRKNLQKSEIFKESGNKLYFKKCNVKSLEDIFKLYTKSIAFAPCDSKALAIGYGNRSALLYRTKKYKESISDINRALAINKIDSSTKLKLLCRKVACLADQGSPNAKKVYNEVENLLSTIEDPKDCILKNIKNTKDILRKCSISSSQKSSEIPEHMKILSTKEAENPFDSIDIQYKKEHGRCLVSTRDFKPGEIIFVEKPYIKFMEQDDFLNYCGHCFIKSWANIPCDNCNWCMFCSEECKNLAWMNYHEIECTTISYLQHYHKIDKCDLISLRSLLIRIKELGSIAKLKSDDLKFLNELDDHECIPVTKYTSLNTKLIKEFNSCHTVTKDILTKYAFTTAIILIILTKYTLLFEKSGEFKDIDDLETNKDVMFIGTVYLKLRKMSENSSHIMHNENVVDKLSKGYMMCRASNCCFKGAYIPPISNSILHSCNPNTQLCETDNHKLIIFALQAIEKNSPLFVARHRWFFEDTSGYKKLKSTCSCEACTQKWPNMVQLYKMPKDKPEIYAKNYSKKESDLYDENNALVTPILNDRKFQFNQTTISRLSEKIEIASKYLKQPSLVICELIMCLNITFNRLYGTDKSC